MIDPRENQTFCCHDYVVYLGENKETKEVFNYCLTCGEREHGLNFHALCINASLYLDEYPIETEEQRRVKMQVIRNQFQELMLEACNPNPVLIIEQFRLMIENKRNHIYKIKGKYLLPMSS